MRNILTLALLCLTVVACSKGSPKSSSKKIKLTPEMMDAVMSRQTISCPSGDCPEAIARLFTINFEDAEESSNCTGTLIGEKLLLTNSHCIDMGTLDEVCDGFYAVFNSRAGGHEVARCEEVLWRYTHTSRDRRDLSNQDYALIKLDRTVSAKPVELNRSGFVPGDKVHPYVIDHIDVFNSRIVKLNCTVSSETSNGRDNVLETCPAIQGNSGSAIFDTDGRAAGVLYAGEDTAVDETTAYTLRIQAPTISLGFPMNRILEDLDPWL